MYPNTTNIRKNTFNIGGVLINLLACRRAGSFGLFYLLNNDRRTSSSAQYLSASSVITFPEETRSAKY